MMTPLAAAVPDWSGLRGREHPSMRGGQLDIAAWLRGLGLGRYEAAFRDNEIRPDVLPSLTADDLKEMGVAAVGDRRRLLDAIAALRAGPPGPPVGPPPDKPPGAPAPEPSSASAPLDAVTGH